MRQEYIYLDNAAATRLDERVLEAMKPYFFDLYAVATSQFGHSPGIDARDALDDARGRIAAALGAAPEEFIFTSGSTESSNLALKGAAMALADKKGRHLVVSPIEDFPVLHSARALERQGFEVTKVQVDETGRVDLDYLRDSITSETFLVSIQAANQEIGTLQDMEAIGEICRERGVFFHTDATHSFPRVPLDVGKVPVDLVTVAAHTIHGPKGIGGLYVRKDTPLTKWMDGGFQEFNQRAGVENIAGAVGFARAVELVTLEETARLRGMRDRLIKRLLEIPHTRLNGHPPNEKEPALSLSKEPALSGSTSLSLSKEPALSLSKGSEAAPTHRLPHNANVSFRFVEGESLLLHLDMRGFAVSTGSACFSRSLEASHVMLGIGGDHERAHGSVRFTFGRYNEEKDVDAVTEAVTEVVRELRRISPLGKE